MHKSCTHFECNNLQPRGVFSYKRLLLWYYSKLSRRGAESDETLESIGLLLFPAPNELRELECIHACGMLWIQIGFLLSSRTIQITLNAPSVTAYANRNLIKKRNVIIVKPNHREIQRIVEESCAALVVCPLKCRWRSE